ncbi:MAG: sulfur carrier protein ThiS [Myxococcales bacterium]|nr:sulfur carrier protein ThiS [Myxococcales bacterium]
MAITLNGLPHSLARGTSVAQLLVELQTPDFGAAVELNCTVVRKKDHAATELVAGDVVEIVHFVGGG